MNALAPIIGMGVQIPLTSTVAAPREPVLSKPPTRRRARPGRCPAGSSIERGMVLAICAAQANRVPPVQEIRGEFGVSRATAYRWHAALKRALRTGRARS